MIYAKTKSCAFCKKKIAEPLFACPAHWVKLTQEERDRVALAHYGLYKGTKTIAEMRAIWTLVAEAARVRMAGKRPPTKENP